MSEQIQELKRIGGLLSEVARTVAEGHEFTSDERKGCANLSYCWVQVVAALARAAAPADYARMRANQLEGELRAAKEALEHAGYVHDDDAGWLPPTTAPAQQVGELPPGLIETIQEAADTLSGEREQRGPLADELYGFAAMLRDGAALATPQPVKQGEVMAWAAEDGRVVPASTMEGARRDGGAMLSSLKAYSIPLVRASAPQPAQQGDSGMSPWESMCRKAVEVLNRHIVPDGISDHEALNELYGIFDSDEYRSTGAIEQMLCDNRQAEEMRIDRAVSEMMRHPSAPHPVSDSAAQVPCALESCSNEETRAFEAWAEGRKYEMRQHPLHYLFLDAKTNAARQGWKAALQFARDILDQVPAAPTQHQEGGRNG